MRKVSLVLAITILILSPTLSLLCHSTTAGPFTTVTIEPEYQETEVNVAPGSIGSTRVQINVTVQTGSPAPLVVKLSANCSGAALSIDPAGMTFQTVGTETQEAFIKIKFPLLTNASDDNSCTVTGTWTQGATSGSAESATIQITILPFYRPVIFAEEPMKEVTQGETTSYDLRVENTGNCDDAYRLVFANQDELEADGITIEAVDEIAIAALGHEWIEVNVQVSSDAHVKTHEIIIVVTSMGSETGSEEPVKEEYPLILKVREKGVGIEFFSSPIFLIIIAVVIIAGILVYIKKR